MRRLLFDLYGLFMKTQTPESRENIERVLHLKEQGICGKDFWRAYRKVRYPYDTGMISAAEYLRRVGAELGAEFDSVQAFLEADCASWSRQNDTMVQWLLKLRSEGIQPALLSNIPADLLAFIRPTHPWLHDFSPCLFSCEIGFAKPNPEVFRYACKELHAAAQDVMFFDDTAHNLPGAEEVGMHTHHFLDIQAGKKAAYGFLAAET